MNKEKERSRDADLIIANLAKRMSENKDKVIIINSKKYRPMKKNIINWLEMEGACRTMISTREEEA